MRYEVVGDYAQNKTSQALRESIKGKLQKGWCCLPSQYWPSGRYRYGTSTSRLVYPVGIFCTVGFGRNSFLKFLGTFILKKSAGNPFSLKRGAECSKRGPKPPFFEGKRGSRQFYDTEMYQPSFLLVSFGKIPRKYQPIPTKNTESEINSKKVELLEQEE